MNLVILDRDGTIIKEPPGEQVDSLEKLELVPGAISGLRLLAQTGYTLVMATNQDGLSTERYPEKSFNKVQGKVLSLLEGEGIRFDGIFICPHLPEDNCGCRKPKTGLVEAYMAEKNPDINNSFVIGDRESDVHFAKSLGLRNIILGSAPDSEADYTASGFYEACLYITDFSRSARIKRETSETVIDVEVRLNGSGRSTVSTGIGFFDHMLEQLAKHSGVEIILRSHGDLDVDEHHSIEDAGIALGEALNEALRDRIGIERYGFSLPMDESTADVLIDLGGRSCLVFKGAFTREKVGEMPTETVEDFFKGLSDGLRCSLHIRFSGRNDHHKIEAIFKSTGRALKQAVKMDPLDAGSLPTTKGKI